MDVRLPDGTVVTNVPDNITQSELSARLQKSGLGQKSNLLDTFDSIDKQQQQEQSQYAPQEQQTPYQGARFLGEKFKQGVAAVLGSGVDLIAAPLVNLGIAGYGTAKGLLTGSSDLPPLVTNPVGGHGTFERLLQYNQNVQPTGPVNKIAGRFVHDLGAASLPVVGLASRPALLLSESAPLAERIAAEGMNPLSGILTGTEAQLAASGAGEAARAVAPDKYKDLADQLGQIGIGLPLGGWMAGGGLIGSAARTMKLGQQAKTTAQRDLDSYSAGLVQDRLRSEISNYPGANERLQEANTIAEGIPGLQPRIGQASGVPSIMDMERRVAINSPENFNRRAMQDEQNRQAILSKAQETLPLLQKNDIADRLASAQTERQALAEALPQTDLAETGQTLRAARESMKSRDMAVAGQKYQAAADEAKRLNVKINPQAIFDTVQEGLSNPILQYDASNAPTIAQRIKSVIGREQPDAGAAQILGSNGQPLYAPRDRVFNIGYEDLNGMRQAVLQDIARERTSPTPAARQRLRFLNNVLDTIDETAAAQSPKSVNDLATQAKSYYRETIAPKYLRGINLKQSLRDTTGEQRIPDEKLAGQYFKKMQSTPTSRFVTLYGDNPTAMHAMENHVLDQYRREVVKDGVIDPRRHDAFMSNYGSALKQLPSLYEHMQSYGTAARLLGAREDQLSTAQSLLSKAQLENLRYDQPDGTLGIDPRKVNSFLQKNGDSFRDSIATVYGKEVADQHIANLQKIAKAAEISERGSLSSAAQPQQSINPADLRSTFGFTGRTVFSLYRAVTTARTSVEDMAYALGAQFASHRIKVAMIKAEEQAIQDPETAKLIARTINEPLKYDSLGRPIMTPEQKSTIFKVLAKGGLYLVGSKNFKAAAQYQAVPLTLQFARQLQQGKEQQ